MSQTEKMKKTIYEYENFRVFLQDYYEYHKAQDKKFSYRYFSRLSGIASPSFLKHVIDGERNLTEDSIQKFAKALKLNKQEASFFASLVRLNQASNSEERERYALEISKHKLFLKFQPLSAAQLKYYEHWYYVAIRELVSLDQFQNNPEWIAKQLKPEVSVTEVKDALQELISLGLLKFNELGRLIQTDPLISTGNEVTSAMVARFHREIMKKASEAIDLFPRSQREISAATFSVSKETFDIIKEKTQKFRKEIQELALQDSKHTYVCQLSFQLFPLSDPEDTGGSF